MSRLIDTHVNDWHNCLNIERSVYDIGGNKLRTINFKKKNMFETEIYCKIALPFSHRCALAKCRIETVRFENLRVDERFFVVFGVIL
jgi:hypothetical protein